MQTTEGKRQMEGMKSFVIRDLPPGLEGFPRSQLGEDALDSQEEFGVFITEENLVSIFLCFL